MNLQAQMINLKQYNIKLQNSLSFLQNERITLIRQLQNFSILTNNMRTEIESLIDQIKQLESIIDQKINIIQSKDKQLSNLKSNLQKRFQQLQQKDTVINELNEQLSTHKLLTVSKDLRHQQQLYYLKEQNKKLQKQLSQTVHKQTALQQNNDKIEAQQIQKNIREFVIYIEKQFTQLLACFQNRSLKTTINQWIGLLQNDVLNKLSQQYLLKLNQKQLDTMNKSIQIEINPTQSQQKIITNRAQMIDIKKQKQRSENINKQLSNNPIVQLKSENKQPSQTKDQVKDNQLSKDEGKIWNNEEKWHQVFELIPRLKEQLSNTFTGYQTSISQRQVYFKQILNLITTQQHQKQQILQRTIQQNLTQMQRLKDQNNKLHQQKLNLEQRIKQLDRLGDERTQNQNNKAIVNADLQQNQQLRGSQQTKPTQSPLQTENQQFIQKHKHYSIQKENQSENPTTQPKQLQNHSINPLPTTLTTKCSPKNLSDDKIDQLLTKVQYMEVYILQLEILNDQLKNRNKQLQQRNKQLQQANNLIQKNNLSNSKKLTEQQLHLQQLKSESQNLKLKLQKYNHSKSTIQNLNLKINNLKTINIKLQNQLAQSNLSSEQLIHRLKNKNQELQHRINSLKQLENDHIDQVNYLKIQLQNKTQQIQNLSYSIKQKNQQLASQTNKFEEFFSKMEQNSKIQEEGQLYKIKSQNLQKQIKQQKKFISDYQRTLFKMTKQSEQIKSILLQKDVRIKSLQRQLQRAKKYNQILLSQMKLEQSCIQTSSQNPSPKQMKIHTNIEQLKKLICQQKNLLQQNKTIYKVQSQKILLYNENNKLTPKPVQKLISQNEFTKKKQNFSRNMINQIPSTNKIVKNFYQSPSKQNLHKITPTIQQKRVSRIVSNHKSLKEVESNTKLLNCMPSSPPSNSSYQVQRKFYPKRNIQISQIPNYQQQKDLPSSPSFYVGHNISRTGYMKGSQQNTKPLNKQYSTPFFSNNGQNSNQIQVNKSLNYTGIIQRSLYQKNKKILEKSKQQKQMMVQKILNQRQSSIIRQKGVKTLDGFNPRIKRNNTQSCLHNPKSSRNSEHQDHIKQQLADKSLEIIPQNIQRTILFNQIKGSNDGKRVSELMTFNKRKYITNLSTN